MYKLMESQLEIPPSSHAQMNTQLQKYDASSPIYMMGTIGQMHKNSDWMDPVVFARSDAVR